MNRLSVSVSWFLPIILLTVCSGVKVADKVGYCVWTVSKTPEDTFVAKVLENLHREGALVSPTSERLLSTALGYDCCSIQISRSWGTILDFSLTGGAYFVRIDVPKELMSERLLKRLNRDEIFHRTNLADYSISYTTCAVRINEVDAFTPWSGTEAPAQKYKGMR